MIVRLNEPKFDPLDGWNAFGKSARAKENGEDLSDWVDELWDSKDATSQIFRHKYVKKDWVTLVDDFLSKKISYEQMNAAGDDPIEKYIMDNGKKVTIPVFKLRPTQPWVGEPMNYIPYRYEGNGGRISLIHIKGTDRYYVANGHHRAIGQILWGKEKIDAYVIEAPNSLMKKLSKPDAVDKELGEGLRKNKMALQRTEVVGVSEMSARELNSLTGSVRELAKKVEMFGKGYEIGFSEFSDGTIMQWKDGKLTISTVKHKLEDGTIFCPADNLRSAISKLRKGETLDFSEEYSIESLFHESVHARATRKTVITAGSMDEKIAETCTQLYARERYVKILKAYGVEPINFERIMTDGLGYNLECSKLRGFFTKDGTLQVGELINIANETESGTRIMIKKLMRMGMEKNDAENFLLKLRMS